MPDANKRKNKAKLSEKGKAKLIARRAQKLFDEQKAQQEKGKKKGGKNKDQEEHLREFINDEQEMERFKAQVAAEIEEEEKQKQLAKLQRQGQRNRNAEKMGLVSKEQITKMDEKIENVRSGQDADQTAYETAEIHLEDPVEVIKTALEISLMGREALLSYLKQPETLEELETNDVRILCASLSADFFHRKSILQMRTDMMWRLGTTLFDFPYGERMKILKLVLRCFALLIEVCDPYDHPFEYAALENSQEQAQTEYDRLHLMHLMQEANSPAPYAPRTVHERRKIPLARHLGRFSFHGAEAPPSDKAAVMAMYEEAGYY